MKVQLFLYSQPKIKPNYNWLNIKRYTTYLNFLLLSSWSIYTVTVVNPPLGHHQLGIHYKIKGNYQFKLNITFLNKDIKLFNVLVDSIIW